MYENWHVRVDKSGYIIEVMLIIKRCGGHSLKSSQFDDTGCNGDGRWDVTSVDVRVRINADFEALWLPSRIRGYCAAHAKKNFVNVC